MIMITCTQTTQMAKRIEDLRSGKQEIRTLFVLRNFEQLYFLSSGLDSQEVRLTESYILMQSKSMIYRTN
jgi:hypothetical protein